MADSQRFSSHAFLAGSIAGAAGTLIGHPLDTLKVYAQAGRGSPSSLRSLFRGIGMPLVTAGAVQSANLGVYENARRALTPQDVEPAPLWTHAAAGAIGGLTITFVTTPLSRIKVQQQLSGASAVATVQSIGSWRSLYAGFSMSSLFEASRGLYMFSYCVIKRRLEVYCDANSDGVLPLWARTVAGASANVVTWGVMYPVESIRTFQQAEAAAGKTPLDAHTCLRQMLEEGGVRRLYRGYLLTIVRAGPVAGVILPCFEVVLPWLEKRL